MNKFFKLVFILFFFYGCSYEPILVNKNYNFSFNNIETIGEKKINNYIKNKLNNRSSGGVKFDIFIVTKKNKEIISSDQKGDPLVFELTVVLNYNVKKDEKEVLSKSLKKKISYNNIKDKFELSKYEENILKNISDNISDEILLTINKLVE